MHVLQMILSSYAQFFNGSMWLGIFTSPKGLGLVATLIVMEGLMSTDNALVLSIQAMKLPKEQRKKALFYGLWGAYLFRFVAIGLGVALVHFMIIKVLGGLYLLRMAFMFFKDKLSKKDEDGEGSDEPKSRNVDGLAKYLGVFWATVITIELLDITFSVDSVLAAFGVSDVVGILLLGGMLGILMMRGVAGIFVALMEKVPELESTAYVLIAFIGFKMLASVFHFEISTGVFFAFLVVSFAVTFLVHFIRHTKHAEA